MKIQVDDGSRQVAVDTNTQLLVMRPEPATADIYIDDEKVPTENGLFTATMKKGTHTYRVEAPMYASDAGVIDLGSEQKIMSVTLKPRFGYLEVFSLPEQDAKVYIDSALVGQTPYRSDRLPLRSYQGGERLFLPDGYPVERIGRSHHHSYFPYGFYHQT